MKISVFLSYPQPYLERQQVFIDKVKEYLNTRGIETRTLGVTDYDMMEPLVAIRRLLNESNGLLTIAFRRTHIEKACVKPKSDIDGINEKYVDDEWITSPYCQIEPSMAFQIGLPILIFREKGVIADGILEKGVAGTYLPEFDLENNIDEYFIKDEWKQIINDWEQCVRNVYKTKGYPPKLY